jgi:hypothetical protein
MSVIERLKLAKLKKGFSPLRKEDARVFAKFSRSARLPAENVIAFAKRLFPYSLRGKKYFFPFKPF